MIETARRREVARPIGDVWAVLADFGAIAGWATNVDHSCLLTDGTDAAGVGAVRRVQAGRMTLLERVVQWDEPKVLAYDLEGLPPVVRSARNDWRLRADGDRTRVTLTSTVDCGPRPPQQVVARVVAARLAKASDQMLAGLTARLEETRA